jgi:hypothetical protein
MMPAGNAPLMGRFGPAEQEKEARWARQRRACWGQFVREVAAIMAGSNRRERTVLLAHWAKGRSEAEIKTMDAWIRYLWTKSRAAHG